MEPPKTLGNHQRNFHKFIDDAKKIREEGYIRLIDRNVRPLDREPTKRSARILLEDFENESEPDQYMFSSKLAVVGTYDDIIEFLEGYFQRKIETELAGEILGFNSESYPILSHSEEYGDSDEESIQIFRELFQPLTNSNLNYNVFDLILIRDRIKDVKINDSDLIGFKKKNGNYLQHLKNIYLKNKNFIDNGDLQNLRYLNLDKLYSGKIAPVTKIVPGTKLEHSIRFEHPLKISDTETITMYVFLGSYNDNKTFLRQLSKELKIPLENLNDVMEAMKKALKIKHVPKPLQEVTRRPPAKKQTTKAPRKTQKVS